MDQSKDNLIEDSNKKGKNKEKIQLKDEFKFDYSEDKENDDYEKFLEKDIETHCDLNIYVDKLEIEEKSDEELIQLEKQEIIDFKNYQIQKYKAYINSLEKEKEDLIENFRTTTSALLERLKDLESQQNQERPQTAYVLQNLKENQQSKRKSNNNIQVYNFEKNTEYEISKENEIGSERCPNCTKEFKGKIPIEHSLSCFKSVICKICKETFDPKSKGSHLKEWRSKDKINLGLSTKNKKVIELCFDHGLKTSQILDDKGNTTLHIFASNEFESFNLILGRDIDNIDAINEDGDTPLIIAIKNKQYKNAFCLIDLGANLGLMNKKQLSALMISCINGNIEMCRYLLKNGANVNEKNIMSQTPLNLAILNNNDDLAKILTSEFGASLKGSSSINESSVQNSGNNLQKIVYKNKSYNQ